MGNLRCVELLSEKALWNPLGEPPETLWESPQRPSGRAARDPPGVLFMTWIYVPSTRQLQHMTYDIRICVYYQ